MRNQTLLLAGVVAACVGMLPPPCSAEGEKSAPAPGRSVVAEEARDAHTTREELARLLERYPPALRGVLRLDPALLGSQPYLAPYPGLQSFLAQHPEVARNPSFFIGESPRSQDPASQARELWSGAFDTLGVFTGFGMAIGLLVWLVRTLVDYRRWSRLAKVQADVHTKLLDRFTANNELLSYIQSPAGSRFLESSPIRLDAGPRTMAAPLGRILWSLQGGLVLASLGIGLQWVSARIVTEVAQPFQVLGVLAIALGIGFIGSAIISYGLSIRLGLIEKKALPATREDPPAA